MQGYLVKQPNGKLAFWSCILDEFREFDMTPEEAYDELKGEYKTFFGKPLKEYIVAVLNGILYDTRMEKWLDLVAITIVKHGTAGAIMALKLTPVYDMGELVHKVAQYWSELDNC